MKKNRLITTAISGALIMSLTACSINPLDWFSKNGGENDAVSEASKINKDAVYKEAESFTIPGWDYIDGIQAVNGKMYAVTCYYEYPEYDETNDGIALAEEGMWEEGAPVSDPLVGDLETETDDTTITYEDEISDAMIPAVIDEDIADYIPDEYYGPEKVEMKIASFTNSSDIEEVSFEIDKEMSYQNAFSIDDAENCYLVMAHYNESDYDYSEDVYLWKVNKEGTIEKETELFKNSGDDWNWVSQIICDKDGNVYVQTDSEIDIYSGSDLSKIGNCEVGNENSYCTGLSKMSDGSVVISVYEWTETDTIFRIEKIASNGKTEEIPLSDTVGTYSLLNGNGYDFYYQTNTSIFGINVNDSKGTEIVNFYDSDLAIDNYSNYMFSDVDKLYALKHGGYVTEIARFEKVPADQVADKEIITIGADYLDYRVLKQVMEYNKNNDKYKVKLVDYSQYNTDDDYSAGNRRLYSDLATGQGPDIVSMDSYYIMNLISKGVFEDLTPYMENGNGIKKSDLVYNAQNLYADGEKLYCIYPYFTVDCCMIDKDNYKEGMTFDDVLNWEQATGNKAFYEGMIRYNIMYETLSYGMGAFMDVKTGKCSFDSPEFVKMLEYAKTYPERIDDEFYMNYTYDSYIGQFRENKVLLDMASIYGFRDFYRESYIKMDGNGIPCKFPLSGSEGAVVYASGIMGINAKCKNKEAAWDFIASCFTEDFYEEDIYSMASVESILDKQIEASKEKPYWIDEKGEKVYYDDSVWLENGEVIIPPIPDDYAKNLKEFATHAMGVSCYDAEISKIIDEECQPFFTGQKSAQEVASIIQSRVQIYVNERK